VIRRGARLLWAAGERFFRHNGPDRAAAIALYTLLSLLPLLIFLISLGVAVAGSFEKAYNGTLYLIGGVVVPLDRASRQALRDFVERAVALRWGGLLLLAWTGRRMFMSLVGALHAVFEVPSRGFFVGLARGNLLGLGLVLVTGLGLVATLALTTLTATAEGLLRRLPLGGGAALAAFQGVTGVVLDHVVPPLITLSFLFIVYRVVPRRYVTTRQAAIGALVATVLWELAKAGFAWYVRNLAQYVGLYGALEAIIVLALWLELSFSVILFGGSVVALLMDPDARRRAQA
jgi:membrane protein